MNVNLHSAPFGRVVVGVDGSPESLEAARQAAILADGPVTLVSAYTLVPALVGGPGTTGPVYYDEQEQRRAAKHAVVRAREVIGTEDVGARIARGVAWDELLEEVERESATLVAVGTHGHGRASGILLGSTSTELVHKAPCSVLVARRSEPGFPKRIVVGIDGSPESARAYAAAQHIADVHGGKVWPVVARGGKGVDVTAVDALVGHRREDAPGDPVHALVSAAADAHLLVVGSRGLHGLKALGSVSERVAHEARSSVLVVRGS